MIFGVVFFGKYTENVFRVISDQIAGDIKVISRALDSKEDNVYIDKLKKDFDIKVEILNDTTLKKHGIYRNTKIYRMLKKAFERKSINEYFIMPFNSKIYIYLKSNDNKNVYKMCFLRRKIDTRIIPIVLGWGISSAIILLIIAFIFLKNQIRPIKRLAMAAEQFGRGIDTNTFTPEGALEVRMAGKAFCNMKSDLRKLMNDRMKTLAGISHDLRTPLTKMKLQLGMMKKTQEIEWLLKDVNMMIHITESFTIHASNQNKEMFIHRNLYSFLNEIIKDYNSEKFKIFLEGDKAIEATIKYVSLKRAFGNIISNSKKYSQNAYISFEVKNNDIYIFFEDDGIGIDPEIMADIFSPFVGQNSARTQDGEDANVGLGLSIARDSLIDHGGEIVASNSKQYGGAKFTVRLPLQF